jgi:hypothetical protein
MKQSVLSTQKRWMLDDYRETKFKTFTFWNIRKEEDYHEIHVEEHHKQEYGRYSHSHILSIFLCFVSPFF